jgi:Uma2 family endonuclease
VDNRSRRPVPGQDGGVTTMTEPVASRLSDQPWTIDDLAELPDGNRYEILDGSLIMSPAPDSLHGRVTTLLARLLDRAAPTDLMISAAGFGVAVQDGRGYCVPDIVALVETALDRRVQALSPADVPLAVEVVSPTSSSRDRVSKRHEYAAAGIRHYWIVDPDKQTLTVLSLDGRGARYEEVAVVAAGERFTTDDPFAISLDPADFC